MQSTKLFVQVKKIAKTKLLTGFLVGAVDFDGMINHAMILDTIKNGRFVFKNTVSQTKKFEIDADSEQAPDCFYYVHVQITN